MSVVSDVTQRGARHTVCRPPKELKKVVPLGLMFFFILFSYTILRDTKDVSRSPSSTLGQLHPLSKLHPLLYFKPATRP